MSRRSIVVLLTVCVSFVVLGSERPARAHVVTTNPSVQAGGDRYGGDNPLGIEFGIEPPAAGTTKFSCLVAVRSLLTGDRILLLPERQAYAHWKAWWAADQGLPK